MSISTLIANLDREDEVDRTEAAEDLGYTMSAEAIAPLADRLPVEPSRKVRETIFLALGRIDDPEVMIRLSALLGSEDAFLRNQAVALLQRKGAGAVPVLLARMNSPDADVRKFVLDAAAGIPLPAVEPIYESAMGDADVNVRIAVLEYVGEQRKRRFKSVVEEVFLKATEPMLVCAAFAALLQIGDDFSWGCIRRRYPTAAAVPGWELGWWIRGLGDFGSAGEIEGFHEILKIHDGRVARDTTDALERFQTRHGQVAISEEFWGTLRGMIDGDLSPEDRLQLLRVVGGFRTPAGIGEHLMGLLERSDPLTRLGAIEGLKRFGRPDLMALLRTRIGTERDPDIAEALAGC